MPLPFDINASFEQARNDNQNILTKSSVKYASPDYDMYRFQDDFDNIGFNPFDPAQHDRWANKETTWTALEKGFDSFATRFGNTFTDYWKDWGRMGKALITWDLKNMMPEESELIRQYNEDQKEQLKNTVFVPLGTEDDIFSKKTVSEFVGNAGFALGTFAGMAVEFGVDALITVATEGAGAASFAATGARIAGKQAGKKAAKSLIKGSIDNVFKGMVAADRGIQTAEDAVKVAKQIEQVKALSNVKKFGEAYTQSAKEMFTTLSFNLNEIRKSKTFGTFIENTVKGVPLLGTGIRYGERIAKAGKAGASGAELFGMGLQATRRVAQELNLASTESSFEAVSTYGESLDNMIALYQIEHNGESPSALELEQMKGQAGKAAYANYKSNLAILLATNRLQFGSLFNRFPIANRWVNDVISSGEGKNVLVKGLFKGGQKAAQVYEKSKFFGTYGVLGKVAKDFGTKQAVWLGAKTFGKNVFKFEVTEGLQENLQETSAIGWRNYYVNQYEGVNSTLSESMGKGLSAQWSKQGLKTFLMGAFTGMLVSGPTKAMTQIVDAAQTAGINRQYKNDPENNPINIRKKQEEADRKVINTFYDTMSKENDRVRLLGFALQVDASMAQTQAAAKNEPYEFTNARDLSVLHAALVAERMGMSKAFVQSIKDMGVEMSDAEFETAFGIKLSDTKYKSAREFTEKAAKDVERYTGVVSNLRDKVNNMIDPRRFDKEEDRTAAIILRNAQEDAIQTLALNYLLSTRSVERAKSLSQELTSIPEIANSSDYILRVINSPGNIISEIGNLGTEINYLKKSLDGLDSATKKEVNQQIADKEKLIKLLNKWHDYYHSKTVEVDVNGEKVPQLKYGKFVGAKVGETADKETLYDEYNKEVFQTYREIINLKNKEQGLNVSIPASGMEDAFKKVVDFIRLDQDAIDYMNAYNVLFNTEQTSELILRMATGKLKYYILSTLQSTDEKIKKIAASIVWKKYEGQNELEQAIADTYKVIKDIKDIVHESEPFKLLVVASSNTAFGSIDDTKVITEALEKLEQVITDAVDTATAKYNNPVVAEAEPVQEEKEEEVEMPAETTPTQSPKAEESPKKETKKNIEPEYEKGEYAKVLQLVRDTIAGKNINTPENLQLLTNYPKLFEAYMDIERRRQAELDKINDEIDRLSKQDDSNIRIKVEKYTTLDINETPVEVTIITYKAGNRVLQARQINEDGSIEPMAYAVERINNKAQLSLTNNQLVEGYIGNENNTLKKVSEKSNDEVNQEYINKINAKYDAELAELGSHPTTSQPISTSKFLIKGDVIGSQGITEKKMLELIQRINTELNLGLTLTNNLQENIALLAPHTQKVVDYVKMNPVQVIELSTGLFDIDDGNHRANLLRMLGEEMIPSEIIKKEPVKKESEAGEQIAMDFEAQGTDVHMTESGELVFGAPTPEKAQQVSKEMNETVTHFNMVSAKFPDYSDDQIVQLTDALELGLEQYNKTVKKPISFKQFLEKKKRVQEIVDGLFGAPIVKPEEGTVLGEIDKEVDKFSTSAPSEIGAVLNFEKLANFDANLTKVKSNLVNKEIMPTFVESTPYESSVEERLRELGTCL